MATITADWSNEQPVQVGDLVCRIGDGGPWQPADAVTFTPAVQTGRVVAIWESGARIGIVREEPSTPVSGDE